MRKNPKTSPAYCHERRRTASYSQVCHRRTRAVSVNCNPNPICNLPAPEITTRHIVLSARPEAPSSKGPNNKDDDMSWSTFQNPPRPSYPKELLKHSFMPYGSLAPPKDAVETMDVDRPQELGASDTLDGVSPAKKQKRRKEGDGSPKKTKKTKIANK